MGERWEFRNPLGYDCVAKWDGELLRIDLQDGEIYNFNDDDYEIIEPAEIFRSAAPSLEIARRELWMLGVTLEDIRRTEVVE